MLTELYQYALEHNLAARPGFKPKPVKCYVQLTADGRFVDIRPAGSDKAMAPDIGGLAQGPNYCNILIEKAVYPLRIMTGDAKKDRNTPTKHDFFVNAMREGGNCDPALRAIAAALSDEATRTSIAQKLCEKYKPADPIGFEVSNMPAEEGTAWRDWWEAFRKKFDRGKSEEEEAVCLITGQSGPAMETVPKVSGLMAVGGHTAGDAFLCFDKDAFTSYGLKKSANAPVSEEAMTAVNAALTALIGRAAKLNGAKIVYWYSRDIPPKLDPMPLLLDQDFPDEDFDLFGDAPQEAPEVQDKQLSIFDQSPGGDGAAQEAQSNGREAIEKARREAATERKAKELIKSVEGGRMPELPDARYYIMPLSGMSGRMMVRGWYEGPFEALYAHVGRWYSDLALTLPGGRGDSRPPKLKRLCAIMLKPGSDPKKVFDRMDKELAGMQNRLLSAIIDGAALPDAVASKALYSLRSSLMSAGGDDSGGRRSGQPPLAIYQLLKCWLTRRQRERGVLTMEKQLNPDYPGAAYHCGRMMAVYGAIQQEAMGRDIGAGVIERYYGAAIVSPRFVLGSLSRLSNYHLSKIENQSHALRFRRMLSDISTRIAPGSVPQIMSMEQQTEFALGYYQQNAAIYTKTEAGQYDEQDQQDFE